MVNVIPSAPIPSALGGFGSMGRCIKAFVKNLAQYRSIHSIVCSNGDYPGLWFSTIPFARHRNIHSLADNLKNDPSAGFFGGMNHAFASVNAGRELARRFPQGIQGKRLFRFIAPRPKDL